MASRSVVVGDTPGRGATIYGATAYAVRGTTGPLTVAADAGDAVTLGDTSHSIQGLRGEVDLYHEDIAQVTDFAPGTLNVTIDDAGDPGDRVVTVGATPGGFDSIVGLAPAPIRGSAGLVVFTIDDGTGSNTVRLTSVPIRGLTLAAGGGRTTLQGPVAANDWTINAGEGGVLDRVVNFTGVAGLAGGAAADSFALQGATASIPGSLDGGAGHNRLLYFDYPAPIQVDLAAGTATAVGGSIRHIQSYAPAPAPIVANPGDQSGHVGDLVPGVAITASGGDGDATHLLGGDQAAFGSPEILQTLDRRHRENTTDRFGLNGVTPLQKELRKFPPPIILQEPSPDQPSQRRCDERPRRGRTARVDVSPRVPLRSAETPDARERPQTRETKPFRCRSF